MRKDLTEVRNKENDRTVLQLKGSSSEGDVGGMLKEQLEKQCERNHEVGRVGQN